MLLYKTKMLTGLSLLSHFILGASIINNYNMISERFLMIQMTIMIIIILFPWKYIPLLYLLHSVICICIIYFQRLRDIEHDNRGI